MKTAISISNPLFEAAEALAERLGVSRSELYSRAVESYLERHRSEGVTARLDEVYADRSGGVDPGWAALQATGWPKDEW